MVRKGEIYYTLGYDSYMDEVRPYYDKVIKVKKHSIILENMMGHGMEIPKKYFEAPSDYHKVTKKHEHNLKRSLDKDQFKVFIKWKLRKVI
jgi:hypothetical protein